MCSPCGQQFHFEGTVEYGFTNYSLLDVMLTQNFPHVVLKQNDGFVLHFGQPSWFTLHSVIELCCGVGGLGNGSMAAGFPPVLAIDTNPRMTRMYSGHSAAATITGDINDTATIVQAWKMQPHASVVASGFSCQPFSLLGDRRSSEDPRSVSVTATLDFAILMHSRMVVLECVPPALGDAFVQAEIQRFVQITGFNVSQTTLHLDHVWPSKRSRWWCVLSAKEFGPIQLDPFPVMDELPKVNHLIPTLGVWSRDDELTLQLDEKEVRAFRADTDQAVKYLLNMEGCAPTALHSWGNQLRGCHCGCRAYALSSDRLNSRGLFGLLVRFTHPDTGALEYRHVHPNEAAALTGFDPMHVLDEDLRLGLAGIGQIASPLQSCWAFSHLGDLLHRFGFGVPALPPTFNLQALRSWLVHRCQQLWPPGSNLQDQKFCALVEFWNATPSLPMEELMDPKRWQPILGFFPSIGMVLGFIIRALGGDQESKDLIHDVLSMEMDVDSPVLEGFFALQPSEDLFRQLSGTVDVEVDELDLTSEADLNLTRVHSDRPCTDSETVSTKVLLGSHPGPLMPLQSATCHGPGSVLHPTANCPSEPRSVPLHGIPDDCPSNPGRVPYSHTDCPSNPGIVPNPAALCPSDPRSVPLPCSIPAVCPSNPGSVLPTHADCPSNPGSVLTGCHEPFAATSDQMLCSQTQPLNPRPALLRNWPCPVSMHPPPWIHIPQEIVSMILTRSRCHTCRWRWSSHLRTQSLPKTHRWCTWLILNHGSLTRSTWMSRMNSKTHIVRWFKLRTQPCQQSLGPAPTPPLLISSKLTCSIQGTLPQSGFLTDEVRNCRWTPLFSPAWRYCFGPKGNAGYSLECPGNFVRMLLPRTLTAILSLWLKGNVGYSQECPMRPHPMCLVRSLVMKTTRTSPQLTRWIMGNVGHSQECPMRRRWHPMCLVLPPQWCQVHLLSSRHQALRSHQRLLGPARPFWHTTFSLLGHLCNLTGIASSPWSLPRPWVYINCKLWSHKKPMFKNAGRSSSCREASWQMMSLGTTSMPSSVSAIAWLMQTSHRLPSPLIHCCSPTGLARISAQVWNGGRMSNTGFQSTLSWSPSPGLVIIGSLCNSFASGRLCISSHGTHLR